jgi:hypothetical protein
MAFKIPFRKARGQAPSGGQDVSELVRVMTHMDRQLQDRNDMLRRLPIDPEWQLAEFGPLNPIPSDPLDNPNQQGFAVPRIYQYPAGYNYRLTREHMSWETLKQAADQPLARACIEIRKNRISTLDWAFRIKPAYVARMARKSGPQERLRVRGLDGAAPGGAANLGCPGHLPAEDLRREPA